MECGDALGYMTSELKANEYISEFVRRAPRTIPVNNVILGRVK
jgi:hypothetical protein